jgi:hypothetical protein
MAEPVRHRQTKEAETDMFYLKPPRHISTLPLADVSIILRDVCFRGWSGHAILAFVCLQTTRSSPAAGGRQEPSPAVARFDVKSGGTSCPASATIALSLFLLLR